MRYFILLLSLLVLGCSSQSKDCSKFKTGTFKYRDSNRDDWVITRNDSIQIESNTRTGVKIIGSIKWQSDCKFILTYEKFINKFDNNNMINSQIEVDIIRTEKDSYRYHAYNDSRELKNWLIKVN